MARGRTLAWDGEIAPPRARPVVGRAAPLGRDTAAVLDAIHRLVVSERIAIRDAEVDGRRVDVVLEHGRIAAVVGACRSAADRVIDAGGGALIPGLHDHHVHLLASAAARSSTPCGPPAVSDRRALADALRAADAALPTGQWLRGVGYHESVAGDLDRVGLDILLPTRPCRVQHRSGHAWILNGAALAAAGIAAGDNLPGGVEIDASGAPTGRIYGLDEWLRSRVPRHRAGPDGGGRATGELRGHGDDRCHARGDRDRTRTRRHRRAQRKAAPAGRHHRQPVATGGRRPRRPGTRAGEDRPRRPPAPRPRRGDRQLSLGAGRAAAASPCTASRGRR